MIITETSNYRVVHSTKVKLNNNYAIYFNPWVSGKTEFQKLEIRDVGAFNIIHVQTKSNCWWQHPCINYALDDLRSFLPNNAKVITYGGSMGGYAAIVFANKLGAKGFISIAPQYSLSKKFRKKNNENRWIEETKFWNFDHFESLKQLPCGVVIYDPFCLADYKHIEAMMQKFSFSHLKVDGGGHKPHDFLKNYAQIDMFSIILKTINMSEISKEMKDYIKSLNKKYQCSKFAMFFNASIDEKLRLIKDKEYKEYLYELDPHYLLQSFQNLPSQNNVKLIETFIKGTSYEIKKNYLQNVLKDNPFISFSKSKS